MVTLNLTLLIEVGLFLIFLWGTARFILHPLLDSIDERETGIAQKTNGTRKTKDVSPMASSPGVSLACW